MKRSMLAAIVGTLLASGNAAAVNLSATGLGQVLIYPYYTVNAGNQTLLSVVNTRDEVKAVRVRAAEGRNGRTVLEFNLYLSPFDVWTAAVFSTAANGPAGLVTADSSCTVPAIRTGTTLPLVGTQRFVPFSNLAYTAAADDGGGAGLDRTREGRFEIIEMGVVPQGTGPSALGDEAIHRANGLPADCGALVAAWTSSGVWTGGGAGDATHAPTGGIAGHASIVDVQNGTMLAYDAVAIDGFFDAGEETTDLHFAPTSGRPTLDDARTGSPIPPVSSLVMSSGRNPVAIESSWSRGVDAVSAVLMASAVQNEYTTDAAIGATTEWIVTFPTKSFYVDDVKFGGRVVLAPYLAGLRLATLPFAGLGFSRETGADVDASYACEYFDPVAYDREEGTPAGGGVILDVPKVRAYELCEEVNVIAMTQEGTPSRLLGSTRAFGLDMPFVDGWLRLAFVPHEATARAPVFTSLDGDTFTGLPVLGYQVVNVVNGNVTGGILANYAGMHRHYTAPAIAD